MKCHYEVLNVSKNADDVEIKTSYKKLALKWHPDKNLDDTEYAKEQFQLVQQAYEVLSDRHERAWYDSHREQILRGSNSNYEDNNLDVYQYFTTTCFKGYGDDENGFYTIYRTVFEQIAKEDIEYMDDKEEFCDIPTFGNSKSNYNEVVGPFYDYWSSYTTKKSYVWLDPHDIKEAVNRKIFKLIEKENEKIRQKARKERNEEVRNLVAFIRKRDKRVQSHLKVLEIKKIENRQKQEELSKQKRLERIQLNESIEQAEWMKFDNVKSELEELEKKLVQEFGDEISHSDEDYSEEESDNLYCVACNKIFKTPKAFTNHESSKKHRENVNKLKETMRELEGTTDESADEELLEKDILLEETENEVKMENTVETEHEIQDTKLKKKNKKTKNVFKHDDHENDLDVLDLVHKISESRDDISFATTKPKCKRKKEKVTKTTKSVDVTHEYSDAIKEVKINDKKKISKKQKRLIDVQDSDIDKDHCCVTCRADFSSKNKLFDHLKKTGHSVYFPHPSLKNTGKKQNKIHCN